MKVEFVQDYTGVYGKAKKGRIDWVTNTAGKELVRGGYCISIDEEVRELEAVTKENPKSDETIKIPFEQVDKKDKIKIKQQPEKATFWDKITKLWQ